MNFPKDVIELLWCHMSIKSCDRIHVDQKCTCSFTYKFYKKSKIPTANLKLTLPLTCRFTIPILMNTKFSIC